MSPVAPGELASVVFILSEMDSQVQFSFGLCDPSTLEELEMNDESEWVFVHQNFWLASSDAAYLDPLGYYCWVSNQQDDVLLAPTVVDEDSPITQTQEDAMSDYAGGQGSPNCETQRSDRSVLSISSRGSINISCWQEDAQSNQMGILDWDSPVSD